MGAASLYAKLLLQDTDFAAQSTAYRLDLLRRLTNPCSAADKHLKPYLRNQQMLTSLIYNRLSTADATSTYSTAASTFAPTTAFPAALILNGYTRFRTCRDYDRPAVLAQLAEEISAQPKLSTALKSILQH